MDDSAYRELRCDDEGMDIVAYGEFLSEVFLNEVAKGGFKEPDPTTRRNAVRAVVAEGSAGDPCLIRQLYQEALGYVLRRQVPPKKYLMAAMDLSGCIISFG